MPRIALLHRIVLPAILAPTIAILVLTGWLARRESESELRAWDQRLEAAARAAGASLWDEWPTELDVHSQEHAVRLGEATGLRATLINLDGQVIGDSASKTLAELREFENHRDRVEAVAARREGKAFSTRVSSTLGERLRYFAVKVERAEEPLGVVRFAVPMAVIDEAARAQAAAVWKMGGATAAATALGLLYLLSRTAQPVATLASSARALAGGDTEQRIAVPTYVRDELTSLGQSLAEIGKRLAKREYQLHRNWQTQATVLEGMAEGVIAVDAVERILFANRSAGRALGFNAQAIEGRTLLEAVRNHQLREACQAAMSSGESQEREVVWRSTGNPRTFEAGVSPLPGEPCPGAVLVLRDVTELKRLEGLRQQFIANVSHELKTPLSSIKAYTETLLNGALADQENAERFLRRIDEQGDRLIQLVQDMLSLARMESGQATLEFTDVPVAKVTARCIADYEPQATAASVQIVNEATDDSLAVRADEEALWQILSNLVDNAVKYTPAGGSVTLRAQRNGEAAIIEVADTGVGIPAEHHARVFERFYRVDRARSRELGGTGLGLSIVKHLTQHMAGSVAVVSAPGKGTTFSITLPLSAS